MRGGKVIVDPDLCVGTGDCERLAPAAFRVDEALGISVPLEGAATTDRALLERAAGQCPTEAIRLVDEDADEHAGSSD